MSFFGKEYKFSHHENMEAFLKADGIPEEHIPSILQYSPSYKITKDGDTYTLITITPEKTEETKFKSGVELDETSPDNITAKTTYYVDGNTIKQIFSSAGGTATFLREYNGDELVITVSSPKFNVVAKRWYKAV